MDALRDVRVVAVTAQMAVMDFSPPFTAGSGENASSSVCTQLPNDKPITRKPADVRMGKGKGAPEGFVAPVTPGRIIIEAEGVSYEIAKEALRLAAQKLPITTKFVVRRDYDIQNQNA